ncbi:glycosyltransferase [Culturomica massiliensis]|uniref:glycosyltransferase n=1 Tax=Culturomica massiliensis TaxID=1841857 RepID=UPI0008398AEE|nr:glycosyltransferase [Culturomica massiliensis]
MNILYFADSDITINKGGVNRVTHFLSREFMNMPGWKCYLAYLNESKVLPVSEFNGKIHVSADKANEQIKEFIETRQITQIIVNLTTKKNIYFSLPILYALKSEFSNLHIIFCYHTYPGCELFGIPPGIGLRRLLHLPDRMNTLKSIIQYIVGKTPFSGISKACIRHKYRFIYDHCDRLVLLSPHYIPRYAELADIKGANHIIAIPNPLSLPEILSPDQLIRKHKEVLIVARLTEPVKRLSLALKIWQIIEKTESYNDWKLVILGNGEDELYYKTLAHKLGLKNISFEGRKEPLEYYRRASIFMMTSLYEGWGLTLVEAQQMGVVPIAFESYEALQDMIRNHDNGILIPDRHIHEYAAQLKELMTDFCKREEIAVNALASCRQFSIGHIVQKWCRLFSNL